MPETTSDSTCQTPVEGPAASSAFAVSLSFGEDDLSKPRWSFVQPAVFDFEYYLSLGPLWATTDSKQPYELTITLDNPKVSFVRAELFNSTDGSDPVKFTIDGSTTQVSWPGLPASDWQRWVYRIFVHQDGAKDMPVHIAFSATDLVELGKISERIARGGHIVEGAAVIPEVPVDSPTLKTRVELIDDSVWFPDWYDYTGLTLPAGLTLEPMIVFKALDETFKFQFENPQGLFVPTQSNLCNPGGNGVLPLSLIWEGVDPPPLGLCPSAAGFLNSTLRDSKRLARVLWNEPSEGEIKRTSTFFFNFSNANRPDLVRPIDPTIVHDPDLPP